jgi:hypothetical protein
MFALSVQVDVWVLIGALGVFAAAVAWLVGLHWMHKANAAELTSHEDLCSERYGAIEASQQVLAKTQDERHLENRERLKSIDDRIGHLDEKMDLLMARLR